ncbi:MAG: LptF/LptG family permease [Kiritimatiellaeota bacterium]|nr:LptF/LptG family permease [Kiritimatiellota bacterium]
MRILTTYITRQFLLTFAITLVVFLFVMAVGNIFKVIDLFSRGVPGLLILQVFSYGIPFSLIFAIPMSVMAAAFLIFSRMASDRELIAMKACGISLWQVVQAPVLIAALLSLVCIYINCNLAPDSHYARRTVLGKLGVETPLSLLDEGRFIRDFPGYTIYIARKDGQRVSDIVIYEFNTNGVKRTVRAKSGTIAADKENPGKIMIRLFQVRIDEADDQFPNDLSRTKRLSADEYPVPIDVAELMHRGVVWKKRADLTMLEIFRTIRGSLLFTTDDFTDLNGLARVLADPPNRLADFIQAHLSDSTMARLNKFDGSPTTRAGLPATLVTDLNRLMGGPCLYTAQRFEGVNLNNNTRTLLEHKPTGDALLRLNRMLLEDAYPAFLARNFLSNLKAEDAVVHRMSLMVEASTRLALSLSCYAFVLLGAALGMKIHRKESSIGIAVSLLLVFIFYFFIIIADAMVNHPEFQPHLIVWIPFVASEIIGYVLIKRAN